MSSKKERKKTRSRKRNKAFQKIQKHLDTINKSSVERAQKDFEIFKKFENEGEIQ